MNKKLIALLCAIQGIMPGFGGTEAPGQQQIDMKEMKSPAEQGQMVRLSRVTVDPARLDEYKKFLKEGVQASMQREPGVLVLYAVFENDRPNEATILEIYADRKAYESHIKSPHFQKYKQGTLEMVQDLKLIDGTALTPEMKIK